MKANADRERCFMAELDGVAGPVRDAGAALSGLEQWQARLLEGLDAHRLQGAGLAADGQLARQLRAIDGAMQAHVRDWPRQWLELAPSRRLATAFGDRVVLLVFGKFNAGKSSLCNFLAERFAAHGHRVGYFHVHHGRVVDTGAPFREGATETTAQLQGVRLGARLVLIDTPGLHSTTGANAELTRRFTDSADGVLWLTSSSSPGQVQELDELARELHRNKPLLPVITRSDLYEEDEAGGEIRKCLCNKSPDNRALQEDDVAARAREKLASMGVDPALLEPPVSLSVHVARTHGQSVEAMDAAGFSRLYAALHGLVEPALAYRDAKPAAVLLHHLEENVLGALLDDLLPRLAGLEAALQAGDARLDECCGRLVDTLWRRVVPALPELLDRHSAGRDAEAVGVDLAHMLGGAARVAASEALADFDIAPEASIAPIAPEGGAAYEDIGLPGDAAEVDYTRLHAALEGALRTRILQMSGAAARQSRTTLRRLLEDLARLRNFVLERQHSLIEHKRSLDIRKA